MEENQKPGFGKSVHSQKHSPAGVPTPDFLILLRGNFGQLLMSWRTGDVEWHFTSPISANVYQVNRIAKKDAAKMETISP